MEISKTRIIRLLIFPFAIWALGSIALKAQPASEKGNYLSIQNFTPGEYHGPSQNFDISEDNRGVLYFANSLGILVFDGIFWNNISLNNGAAYSLESDEKGLIYAGGLDEFGYLAIDPVGQQEYVSLLPYLDSAFHGFGEIWEVNATQSGVYFKADNYLFRWNGDTISTWQTDNRFHTSFFVNNELYVREEGRGLLIMQDDSLRLTEGGEKFKDFPIQGMIPFKETGILIFTADDGIFHMISTAEGANINLIRHFNEIDNFLFDNTVSCAVRINYNLFAVGSHRTGAIIYDQSNDQFDFLNFSSGLQDEVIYNMHLDKRGNLWLVLSNGISMSPVGNSLTVFGYSTGIKESVEGIGRFRNRLFLSTLLGTFYLDNLKAQVSTPDLAGTSMYNQQRFNKITDIDEECYACANFSQGNEDLFLVATFSGISQIDKDLKVSPVLECYPWFIYQSRHYPRRVIIANEDGIESVYRSEGKWQHEESPEDISDDCRSVVEDHSGNAWVGTVNAGKVYRISYGEPGSGQKPGVTEYNSGNNLPEGDVYVKLFRNELLFGTSRGLYRYDENEKAFHPDTSFGKKFADGSRSIHRISTDHEGYLWLVAYNNLTEEYETGYFVSSFDESHTWINEPFLVLSKSVIHSIFHDPDGVSWLGGPDGLYRYDRKIQKDYKLDFNTLIRKVSVKGDSLIFAGTFKTEEGLPSVHQNTWEIPTIKYRFNSIAIEYGSPNNEDGSPVLFSHYLEGFDEEWHEWSQEYRREYTNLRENTYTFHVKARNLYKHESKTTSYTFVILPPWYRRVPVIIAFGILIVAIVWLIVILYTRGLKSVIRERTAEIREQKELIEDKNQDILASITYAQRIQSAMLTPGDYMDGLFPERFILYMPRDIVSGDYYWMIEKNERIICVTADCTGHGVPGAMMSMMGMSYLNEITSLEHDMHSDEILNQLRTKIVESLRQKGDQGGSQDGMDVALYVIDLKKDVLEFSGAELPLYLFRNNELTIIKGDKMPIGISSRLDTPFTRNTMDLKKGDILYTFSDGFQDQFGGPKNKKFMIKRLRELLSEIHSRPLRQQKNILKKRLEDWMAETDCEQIDDITVLGVKI